MSVRTVARSRIADQSGLGMIEVMIAIFVLAVALMALASVSLSTLDSLRDTRDREQATNAASSAIEDVRSRDFEDIALAPGTVDPNALPDGTPLGVADTECFGLESQPDGEPLVVGEVDDPVPFERTAGDDQAYTVHTLVTYDEVVCGDEVVGSPLKRITAIVSWADGGAGEVLVETTTVTDVDRGLPVPRFEIRPQLSTIRFSESFLNDSAEDPHRRCSEHILRNLGAEDSYDWEVVASTRDDGDQVDAFRSLNAYDAHGWRYTAHLEPDPDEIEREGEPPASSSEYRFREESGFVRLVSGLRLDSGESGLLTLCAEPTSSSDPADLPDEVEVDMLVRSRFDERVEREVTVTVRIADPDDVPAPGEPLYLFDHDDSGSHDRYYEPGEMGPLADEDDSDELAGHLTTHKYDPVDANWSTDVVPEDDIAGKRLRVDDTGSNDPQGDEEHTAAWHYQFGSKTTLEPDATLVLWVAPTYVFEYSLGGDEFIPLALDVRVDELKPNEKVDGGWEAISEHEYTHEIPEAAPSGGWQEVTVDIDLGAKREFSNSSYIRVRVTCVPAEGTADISEDDDDDVDVDDAYLSDCNLAYDNEDLDSALYIQER